MEAITSTTEKDWLTVKEAAEELGTYPQVVYRMLYKGLLEFRHPVFGIMRVSRRDVERLKSSMLGKAI